MRLAALIPVLLVCLAGRVGSQNAGPTATTVRGVVFDSLARRSLRGAVVQIVDVPARAFRSTATSDSLGRFEFRDIAAGSYLVGFFHPTLDSLGLDSQVLRVDVQTNALVSIRLAIPSAKSIARMVCGSRVVPDSTGLMLGYLRRAQNSVPPPGGTISVRWSEFVIGRGSIRQETFTAPAVVAGSGHFIVCGAPRNTPLLVQASSATDSSGLFEVLIPNSGLLHRDVFIAPLSRTMVQVGDSLAPVPLLRGPGRLRGRVVGSNQHPVANARVVVWGTGLDATTNDSGYFSLGNLPIGTHTLDARAVGFAPTQLPVDITSGAADDAAVELTTLGVTLAPVKVTAQRLYSSLEQQAFDRRVKMGFGHIYDDEYLNRRQPETLTSLFKTVPGVTVVPGMRADEEVLMRSDRGLCRPDVFLDGVRVRVDELFPMNLVTPMSFVRAVEVYAHSVPIEFASSRNCGAIVIWTGGRRGS